MLSFRVHTLTTAPEASKATLEGVKSGWGMLPNLIAVLAESPAVVEASVGMFNLLSSKGTLTPVERNLVAIAMSRKNDCHYCVAAHSTFAIGASISPEVLAGLRNGQALMDRKLETLRLTTLKLLQENGWLSEADQKAFYDAGYDKAQLLEVIAWIGLKTITNFTNHIANTPVDQAFLAQAWSPQSKR